MTSSTQSTTVESKITNQTSAERKPASNNNNNASIQSENKKIEKQGEQSVIGKIIATKKCSSCGESKQKDDYAPGEFYVPPARTGAICLTCKRKYKPATVSSSGERKAATEAKAKIKQIYEESE